MLFQTPNCQCYKSERIKTKLVSGYNVHSYAGLPCKEVSGHAKSVGYEPGMKIPEDKFTNTWNVVLILGDWWPVQCNWGARYALYFI